MIATFLDGHSDLVTVLLALVAIVLIVAGVKLLIVILGKF